MFWSRHLECWVGCWGRNTCRIQNKVVYPTFYLQVKWQRRDAFAVSLNAQSKCVAWLGSGKESEPGSKYSRLIWGECVAKDGDGDSCDSGQTCASGRCAMSSYCGFFKGELASRQYYPPICDGCNLANLLDPDKCAIQEMTLDINFGFALSLDVGFIQGSAEAGLGLSVFHAGHASQQMGFTGIGIGAGFSIINPAGKAGEYAHPKKFDDSNPCPAGYYCPAGTVGIPSDFTPLGKYHGGSLAWKAESTETKKEKDLRCKRNYWCVTGPTSPFSFFFCV